MAKWLALGLVAFQVGEILTGLMLGSLIRFRLQAAFSSPVREEGCYLGRK